MRELVFDFNSKARNQLSPQTLRTIAQLKLNIIQSKDKLTRCHDSRLDDDVDDDLYLAASGDVTRDLDDLEAAFETTEPAMDDGENVMEELHKLYEDEIQEDHGETAIALEISKIFNLYHPSLDEVLEIPVEAENPMAILTQGNKQYDPLAIARQLGLDDVEL